MKAPREDYDCLDDGVKLVAHEVKFYFSGQIQRTYLGKLIPISSLKSVELLIFYQVAMPRIECKEQEQADICLRPGCRFLFILFFLFYCFFYVCRLVSNNTDCLTTDIPTEVCLSLYWIAFVSRYF